MHTTKINEVTFIHHGDFEGEVQINSGNTKLLLDFDTLKEFVIGAMRGQLIGSLEQMDSQQLEEFFLKR